MKTRRALLAFGVAMSIVPTRSARAEGGSRLGLRSPNGRIEVELVVDADGRLTYSVAFDQRALIVPSPLGLRVAGTGPLTRDLRIMRATVRTIDRHYTLIAGKTRNARDHCNQLTLALEDMQANDRRRLQLIFRAYDDGVAFRYGILPLHHRDVVSVEDEFTRFDFPADLVCWAFNPGTFTSSHEGEFRPVLTSAIRKDDIIDVPLVCLTDAAAFAIAEADLKDYAGCYLRGHGDGPGVQVRLSPRLDDPNIAVRGRPGTGVQSSWRVLMIADRPGDLIGSTLMTNLNPPARLRDSDWVRPGKYAWDWWNGGLGMNDAGIRRFIDFAADAGLQYMLIDAGWYVSAAGDEGGPSADVTRSIPDLHLASLVEYARRRNVGLLVWVHWRALDAQMDKALALYQRLGLKGIKVDFMDRNDQEMVAFYHRLLAKALQRGLLVDLHGSYPPTGLQRTYPNLLTQEGVMGAEYNKWSARVTAAHNVTLPFTRMLLGPMDYTPGGFRNVTPQDFVARNARPLVQTTRGQALAMYVVYESPLMSLADSPDAYLDQPGTDFLTAVPVTWDETRCIAGDIGQFIVIARRRGRDWFVGAMTNETARIVAVPLDFLGDDRCIARIYADGNTPTALMVAERTVGRSDTIELRLAPGGGGAVEIVPARFVD